MRVLLVGDELVLQAAGLMSCAILAPPSMSLARSEAEVCLGDRPTV